MPQALAGGGKKTMTPSAPELKNIQAIIGLERDTRESRSSLDRITDAVSAAASSPAFIVVHLVWFGLWIGLNRHGAAFDPFPFNLLTLAVSLEAIVLTGFVLMAQSRMTVQADKRAHLDLQINLLAEQELTAILKLQCLLAQRAGIDLASCDPRLEQLIAQTDVRTLSATLDQELATVDSPDRPPADRERTAASTSPHAERRASPTTESTTPRRSD
jgi:uncharacterized membrane protein